MLISTFGDTVFAVFIFCVVLFLYLHIQFHLKTSDDLELYEIDYVSKEKLEDICDLRQPTLFPCPLDESVLNAVSKAYLSKHFPSFDIKIKDKSNFTEVPLALSVACKYFDTNANANADADADVKDKGQGQGQDDKGEKGQEQDNKDNMKFSEGNNEFLQETGSVKHMMYNDSFLRPPLVSNCWYDVMFAAHLFETPFKYELNYRNFYVVTQGTVNLKLAPPKSKKYLFARSDYESFEFVSPVNPWNPSANPTHAADFEKVKCLNVTLHRGQMIYIPAYWWFSFQFGEDASLACFKYRTYMNNIAISPHIFMYGLQTQNVVHKLV